MDMGRIRLGWNVSKQYSRPLVFAETDKAPMSANGSFRVSVQFDNREDMEKELGTA